MIKSLVRVKEVVDEVSDEDIKSAGRSDDSLCVATNAIFNFIPDLDDV